MATKYVKKGGDNSLSGNDWVNAWKEIQYGINTLATLGAGTHTLNVEWETYFENIEFKSNIHLIGHPPGPTIEVNTSLPCHENPTIDGNGGFGSVPTVTCENVKNVTIENFNIINGDGTEGAGIYIKKSQVKVDNCCVFDNTATNGGGIGVIDCNPTSNPVEIIRCNVFNNKASTYGGGIHVQKSINVIIRDNAVFDNVSSEYGGGICLYDSGTITIDKNRILTNECTHNIKGIGGGIGLYKCSDAPSTIKIHENERIHANKAGRSGGGIGCNFFSYASIHKNRITSNKARLDGGGIYVLSKGINPPTIATAIAAGQINTVTKNEISDNEAGDDGGGVYGTSTTILSLEHNQIFENKAASNGGGVHITFNSQCDLKANNIHDNKAGQNGGGISGRNANLIVHDSNVIHLNESRSGGGLFLHTDNSNRAWRVYLARAGFTAATLTIQGSNQITSNESRGDGGGLCAINGGYPIQFICSGGNRIEGNHAMIGDGGGIFLKKLADPVISDNLSISGNESRARVTIVLATGSFSRAQGGSGGGICMHECTNITVTNTTPSGIMLNRSHEGHGIAFMSCNGFTVSGNEFGGNQGVFLLHGSATSVPFFGPGAGILFDSCTMGVLTPANVSSVNSGLPVPDIMIR